MNARPILRALSRAPRSGLSDILMLALGLGRFARRLGFHRSLRQRTQPASQPERLVRLWSEVEDDA